MVNKQLTSIILQVKLIITSGAMGLISSFCLSLLIKILTALFVTVLSGHTEFLIWCFVIKLIRSKGVGIFFCTQNPSDIPDAILSQLGMKVQHALRAFTAKDRKMIKLTAQNYPQEFTVFMQLFKRVNGQLFLIRILMHGEVFFMSNPTMH